MNYDTWYHIAMTHGPTLKVIYVNGVVAVSVGCTSPLSNAADLYFSAPYAVSGWTYDAAPAFITDFRFSAGEASSLEIATLACRCSTSAAPAPGNDRHSERLCVSVRAHLCVVRAQRIGWP